MRLRKRKKKISEKAKLISLWHKNKAFLEIEDLVSIVKTEENYFIRKKVLIAFLTRENKLFEDFYAMLSVSRDILKKEAALQKKFWTQLFEICTPQNFTELIWIGEEKASEPFYSKIENGNIHPKKARMALTSLLIKETEEKKRIEIWSRIKSLDPTDAELKSMFDLDGIKEILSTIPKIRKEILETIKRNKKRKEKRSKKIQEIKDQVNRMVEEEQKKQE